MTINPRIARSVRDMRSKLRDLAAAEHGEASAKTAAAAAHVSNEEQALEDTLDEAEDTLTGITNVYALDNVAGLVACQREMIVAANSAHAQATEVANRAEAHLRTRIRQLKTAERVVELVKDYRTARDNRAEQGAQDDLVNARRR
jgi:flagellar biosynthesis chaperone FliJ